MHDDLPREAVALSADERLRPILEDVCRITGMGFAAVARVTEQCWIACQIVDRIEFGMAPADELEIMTTICNDIRPCGEAVVLDDIDGNARWRNHSAPALYGFKSYASLPLYLADRSFFGTLCAIDPERRAVSGPETVAALERYAGEVAAILSAARI